jgi:DNA mismatch repair protein MutS
MSPALPAPSLFPAPPVEDAPTPVMAQYLALKAQHKDCLLFFRLGDFYELFFEDAIAAAKALDIALTRRGQLNGQDVPMCGVPAHAYESYLAKLIRHGFRVAICEQTESPETAKKRGAKSIVTRDVVRIVTPGTVTEDGLLDARAANYLVCLASVGDVIGLCWMDLSAGQPMTQNINTAELGGALARLDGTEILLSQKLLEQPELFETFAPWKSRLVPQPNSRFDSDNARRRLQTQYGVGELSAFGEFSRAEIAALGALLDYVQLTQKSDLQHIARPRQSGKADVVIIDPATRRNLELTRTLSGEKYGSLLSAMDRTETGAGARLLAARLNAPVTDIAEITRRLDAIEAMVKNSLLRDALRASLRQTPDIERALARLSLNRGGPRDLAALRDALRFAEEMRALLLAEKSLPEECRTMITTLGEHPALIDKLQRALATDLPMLARDGNFIARGFAPHLDELITLRDDSRQLIASLQQKYMAASGAANLKIRHNNVIGYYIEVSPTQADRLLDKKDVFIHRQSLASAVRFTTVELGELERKITEAADKALAVELELFAALVSDAMGSVQELRRTAEAIAQIDVMTALATLAVDENYARPVVDSSRVFLIKGGRHPVVEQALRRAAGGAFVPNDCDLGEANSLWLLTGPNMAGKSTFLRQNALIVLMAQMGSFVPAATAHIGVVDKLFSRVGAADDLARGRSTFMVEMVETAAILNQSTEKSLVILDEIGRGTATYDGLSIAWATLEHLHDTNKCRALFATHYHELTVLAEKLSRLRCCTMRIREWEKDIVFLHEVAEGTADRSYGIHVAQMAGLPPAVIARATQVLQTLEADKMGTTNLANIPAPAMGFAEPKAPSARDEMIAALNPDDMSPKDALEWLYKLKLTK